MGPYAPSYTATSAFGKHFRSLHSQLPLREEEYKSVIKRIADSTTTGKRKRTGSSPITIASQLSRMRQPGVIFDEHEYRILLAIMVVETNTAFRTVEVDSFQNLMRYCNGQVPLVSRCTFTGISISYSIAAFARKSASDYSCISLMEHELTSLLMPGLLQIKSPFLLLLLTA